MKSLTTAVFGAVCALGFTATAASADIVCNRAGDCWHVRERHDFRPEFGLQVHPDNWRWAENEHEKYRWREHEGRGYWHNGVWVEF